MPTSIGLRWYQTGTVSVTQGSTALTGVGTNWAGAGIKAGDIFTIDNSTIYEVLTVNSNTSITLATAFAGVTGETLNYSIIRNFAATMQAEIAAQVALLVNKYETYIDTELETITGPKGDPGIVYKGVWAAERNYNAMDAVVYNNVLYLAKVPHISSAENAPGSLGSVWVDTLVTVPPVVNDLTTGGATSALSAEMGKTLQSTKFASSSAGDMTLLNTSQKSTFVGAINEVLSDVGTISSLETTAKTSAVAAINEVNTLAGTANTSAGAANTNIGTMANLQTTEKSSLVGAVNELNTALSVDVMKALREASGAGLHNSIYRGKNLGSTFTAAQKTAISSGTFDDLYVGDYWSFNNITYTYLDDNDVQQTGTFTGNMRIADCNYLMRSGYVGISTPHLIIVPDEVLFQRIMNSTDTTEGAYANAELRTANTGLARARALFVACFGEGSLLSYKLYMANAVTNGKPSASAITDSYGAELMTEQQVYGGYVYNSDNLDGSTVNTGRENHLFNQFNLFRHCPYMSINRQWFWLQDVVSFEQFAVAHSLGMTMHGKATFFRGVRPFFVLRAPAA